MRQFKPLSIVAASSIRDSHLVTITSGQRATVPMRQFELSPVDPQTPRGLAPPPLEHPATCGRPDTTVGVAVSPRPTFHTAIASYPRGNEAASSGRAECGSGSYRRSGPTTPTELAARPSMWWPALAQTRQSQPSPVRTTCSTWARSSPEHSRTSARADAATHAIASPHRWLHLKLAIPRAHQATCAGTQ